MADREEQQKKTPSHLLIFNVVTAGKNGDDLGSDEEQIVLLSYLLYEVANRKVSWWCLVGCVLTKGMRDMQMGQR